jgi:hypothetical protein
MQPSLKYFLLALVVGFHIANDIFCSTYIFLFNQKYDFYFLAYVFAVMIHWFFLKHECLLSYIEKRIQNNNYQLGSKPYTNLYKTVLPKPLDILIKIMKPVNVLWVLLRNRHNPYVVMLMPILFGMWGYYLVKREPKPTDKTLLDKLF